MTTPDNRHPPLESWRWGVVWLMFLATLINYMDRQTLGSLADPVKREFGLNEEGYLRIEFWFGISYGLMQFPAGFLSGIFQARWLYPAALLLWSAAGFCTGLAQTEEQLIACRIVLGIGEAFNWTCAVALVRRLIPLESRSLANGIFHSGASFGAVLTPLAVLALVGPTGENWRRVFQWVGALGLLWTLLWFWCIRGNRAAALAPAADEAPGAPTEAALPFRRVLLLRTFWITLIVSLAINLGWHCFRIWLPRFLQVDLQFSQTELQYLLVGFFLAADLGSLGAGWWTRRLTYAGLSVARARKVVLLGTSLLCTLALPAALVMQPWITIPLLLLVSAGAMGGFANYFALTQEISGRHTSLLMGIMGSSAWIVIAFVQPPVGALVDRLGTYGPPLMVVGFIPLLGALVGLAWPERPSLSVSDASEKR